MSAYGQSPTPTSAPVAQGSRTPVLPIVSFVLSAIAVFFVPILFGGAAIVLAAISMSRRERLSKPALIVSIVATILGVVLGALVMGAVMQQG